MNNHELDNSAAHVEYETDELFRFEAMRFRLAKGGVSQVRAINGVLDVVGEMYVWAESLDKVGLEQQCEAFLNDSGRIGDLFTSIDSLQYLSEGARSILSGREQESGWVEKIDDLEKRVGVYRRIMSGRRKEEQGGELLNDLEEGVVVPVGLELLEEDVELVVNKTRMMLHEVVNGFAAVYSSAMLLNDHAKGKRSIPLDKVRGLFELMSIATDSIVRSAELGYKSVWKDDERGVYAVDELGYEYGIIVEGMLKGMMKSWCFTHNVDYTEPKLKINRGEEGINVCCKKRHLDLFVTNALRNSVSLLFDKNLHEERVLNLEVMMGDEMSGDELRNIVDYEESKRVIRDGRDYVVFWVEDNGLGLDKNFEGIKEGHSVRRSTVGNGFGLYGLKVALERIEGGLVLQNKREGEGARLMMWLPSYSGH